MDLIETLARMIPTHDELVAMEAKAKAECEGLED